MSTIEADSSYLAIDYGRRRVGLAGCGRGVSIAFGITTLIIDGIDDLLKQLEPHLEERNVSDVVLGFPITLGNKPGSLAQEILTVASKLRDRGLKVHLVDEALSSEKAKQKLHQRNRRSSKEDIDRAAAALFLQEYLDGELVEISEAELMKSSDQ